MACEHVERWMMEALDGEIGSEERADLDDHLARCGACRATWDRLQAVEGILTAAPVAPPPPGFVGRVLGRVDRSRRVRRTALGALALLAGTTAVAALCLGPWLWDLQALFPWLWVGGTVVERFVEVASTLLRPLWLTAGALLLPALILAVCGLTAALGVHLLWWYLVRRLQPMSYVRR